MSKGKLLSLCIVWLLVVGVLAVAWRYYRETAAEAEQTRIWEETVGGSQYRHVVNLGLDGFSGYSILRSPKFREHLKSEQIRINLLDDGANYPQRLQRLASGELQMAAFTIDALIKASPGHDLLPATIVAIIDETRGADAMVTYRQRLPNIDALNDPAVRFVATANSPSETLARVVIDNFDLDQLSLDPLVLVETPQQVFARYEQSSDNNSEVYVLWEPYVSRMLQDSRMEAIIDSSKVSGYIVDVLVANRRFLAENKDVVRDVLQAYFTAAYDYRDQMPKLVLKDAEKLGAPLSAEQAERLVEGIWWKNTLENFSHFQLLDQQQLLPIEDMVIKITATLKKTDAIDQDPAGGDPTAFFSQHALMGLKNREFHPGISSEEIRNVAILPPLSEQDWRQLREVGELDVPTVVFAPGTTRLTESSNLVLDRLVQTLENWPEYYLLIRGDASRRGNLEENQKLAEKRAEAVAQYLRGKGVHRNRVHAMAVEPTGKTAVTFMLGQPPY